MTRDSRRGVSTLKDALAAAGLRPRKSLGQNFLVDARALDAIAAAADLGEDDVVLEIGPGPGVLTERLVGAGRSLIACELDDELLSFARERLGAAAAANIEWVSADAIDGPGRLGSDLETALRRALRSERTTRRRWKLVSNLPYGISVPAVLLALAFDPPPDLVVVTVQREVGDRFRAEPGTKDYGAVSVLGRLMSDLEVVRKLGPGCFWPPPRVNSIVIRFRSRADEDRKLATTADFQRFVKACFSERRKQLAPLLQVRSSGRLPAAATSATLERLSYPRLARADALPPPVFASLYRSLWQPDLCGGSGGP